MPKLSVFLDSSALFTGIASSAGAARVLLLLAESGHILFTISEQVLAETERAIARKAPGALKDFRRAILISKAQIVRDPEREAVMAHMHLIAHPADVPILLAAIRSNADYLVTYNRKHFIDDPEVAQRAGLRIGTPAEALRWVRETLGEVHEIEKEQDLEKNLQATLLRLGIAVEYVHLLLETGIQTVEKLSRSNASELLTRLSMVNKEKRLVRRLPSLAQVEKWLKRAKESQNR